MRGLRCWCGLPSGCDLCVSVCAWFGSALAPGAGGANSDASEVSDCTDTTDLSDTLSGETAPLREALALACAATLSASASRPGLRGATSTRVGECTNGGL